MSPDKAAFTSVEICAGAGGQAVGLHKAGFRHLALIEVDKNACDTLELNVKDNEEWKGCKVLREDLTEFDPKSLGLERGELDLLAGGVPCPPFSLAGKQLGPDDERDLFPTMLNMIDVLQPKAVMIENVRGLLEPPEKFKKYREEVILHRLEKAGYVKCYWKVLEACDYGVPQLRPRAILVAMKEEYARHFVWTEPESGQLVTVADALGPSMRARFEASGRSDWEERFNEWHRKASNGVAPTLVGGSKKHGGADLGPTRAKKAWEKLGVCGLGVANNPEKMVDPSRDLFAKAGPKLTVKQAALIQGFPEEWKFAGLKTAAYRQVGNAFPPPVAEAVGLQIMGALKARREETEALPQAVLPAPAEPASSEADLVGSLF
ncbi:DNA cytosine methyltransferase [Streptomyces ehimensis]|uniref:Cytosine-specific methyltransferase n=1 Tax=Streptomyces ehimensis TaxID=68195 RepID=A0ABV9BPR0_9ACTN